MTIREEGVCFVLTGLMVGISLATLLGAFAGAAMIVMHLVQTF